MCSNGRLKRMEHEEGEAKRFMDERQRRLDWTKDRIETGGTGDSLPIFTRK
jgi:hypothetical protein